MKFTKITEEVFYGSIESRVRVKEKRRVLNITKSILRKIILLKMGQAPSTQPLFDGLGNFDTFHMNVGIRAEFIILSWTGSKYQVTMYSGP